MTPTRYAIIREILPRLTARDLADLRAVIDAELLKRAAPRPLHGIFEIRDLPEDTDL